MTPSQPFNDDNDDDEYGTAHPADSAGHRSYRRAVTHTMTLGRDLIGYLGGLRLSGGDHDGEPFTVLPWEARFVRGAFGVPGDAALSVGRGNGKSALNAGIATSVVDPVGPLHGRRREAVVSAASFEQGRVIYEDVLAFLRERYDIEDRSAWRKQDSANRALIEYRSSGARVRCIGSDPANAHGLRPALVLCDEPAQWPGSTRDRMLAALRTGLGKVPGSRLVALGTRPADEAHWFARMLAGTADYSQCHAARPNDPPFHRRTWRRANPSLDHLPSLLAKLIEESEDARRDPDALASFRALRLNQGTDDTSRSVLIDAGTWTALDVPDGDDRGGHVLGVDLGTSAAMSAVAGYWPSGRLEAVACFPETPSLAERGLADGVGDLYQRMHRRGELIVAGRRVSDIEVLLGEALDRWGRPRALVCDRWREAELRDALDRVRFPPAAVEVRGMGYLDGGADVRSFRAAVLGDRVRPVVSLLLTAALAEARVSTDPAGNSKLAKNTEGGRRSKARDDAAAAAVLAVASGFREWHSKPSRQRARRSMLAG